ncbi:MAG: molybdopterin converting factor [Chthoniobacterales bacterium]|nr:MAG: molybdopterin converting factor [Chthoniobacterales bacterium]
MAISVCEVSLTQAPLGFPERDGDSEAGAVVDFWGVVRSTEGGREIAGIEYEAHPSMAEHQMRVIAEKSLGKFSVRKIFIRHRIGLVPAAEPSVIIRVTSGHRAAAFAASQWIMDELKRVVPIWKHPVFKEAKTGEIASRTKSSAALA